MSLTLLTAAQLMRAAYRYQDDGKPAPPPLGIDLLDRYDADTVQAVFYVDRKRGDVLGCAVEGTNAGRDWLRNFDVRPIEVEGHIFAKGWMEGAFELAAECFRRQVTEMVGHSKGAAEAIDAAFLLEGHYRKAGKPVPGRARRVQVIALETPKPIYGRPPLMDALCVRNPRDIVCMLPPGHSATTPGSTFILPYNPPGVADRHRVGPLIAKLLEPPRHGYFALTDDPDDEPAVTVAPSRGAAMAGAPLDLAPSEPAP